MNEEELKAKLTPEQYEVLRNGGTEPPFSGEYHNSTVAGTYACKACGTQLFDSTAKYNTTEPGLMGWPSFDQALPGALEYRPDSSYGMHRTEVVCANCKSHLGHVFGDAEAQTGKHYCINSCALDLNAE